MVIIKGIKAACKWLNHADREITTRNNLFYDSNSNELLAEVKLKDEKYQRKLAWAIYCGLIEYFNEK